MNARFSGAGALLAALLAGGAAAPAQAASDSAGAEAALKAFEAKLEGNASATAVLQAWCNDHHPPGVPIVARQTAAAAAPPAQALRALGLSAGAPLHHRHVELSCGGRVLSRADNWYLPARLTPEMNRLLDATETPFGVAVASLHFTRRNLETTMLFHGGRVPPQVLRHAAVLLTVKGRPFSYVVETYTDKVLGQ